jgi:uncharacterized membrane protein YGL010W
MLTQETLLGVAKLEVFILELVAVDGLATSACIHLVSCVSTRLAASIPSPLVKSPPWIIKSLITRWKVESWYPKPFSPVAKALKEGSV